MDFGNLNVADHDLDMIASTYTILQVDDWVPDTYGNRAIVSLDIVDMFYFISFLYSFASHSQSASSQGNKFKQNLE